MTAQDGSGFDGHQDQSGAGRQRRDAAPPSQRSPDDESSGTVLPLEPGPRGADLARVALAAARRRKAGTRSTSRVVAMRGGSVRALARRRWSGAGPDTRDPQPFGVLLSNWAKQAGAGGQLGKAQLFERWPQIVGAQVAEHAVPDSLVDGVLTLQCSSTAWASQLRMLSRQILGQIAKSLGRGVVTSIRPLGPAAPSWRFGPRHISGRGPRDTYG